MKKELLIKHIKEETNAQENSLVLEWIDKVPANRKYYLSLKNLFVWQNLSQEKANKSDLDEIRSLIAAQDNKRKSSGIFFNKYKRYLRYVALIVVLLSISVNVFFIFEKQGEKLITEIILVDSVAAIERENNTIYTEKGVKAKINLPDGSTVWLNSDSKISYPDKFDQNSRTIEFSGEGYFDVVKDSLRPMIVNTNKNFKIMVLGTKFNVRSYDNDDEAQTTLYSGSLNIVSEVKSIMNSDNEEFVTKLNPLESVIIRDKQKPILTNPNSVQSQTAWKEGKIIFDATPMLEVIKKLERWHGVDFVIKNPSVYKFNITAEFNSESIVQIMEMLRYCALVDYKIEGGKVLLFER